MTIKKLLFSLIIFISINAFAQPSNLIIYTNNLNQKFKLIVNGETQNYNFEENVRLENIEAKNYKIKIVFENRTLGYIEKQIYVRPNTEKMYSFKKPRKPSGRRQNSNSYRTSPLILDLLSETPLFSVDDEYMGEANDANDAINYTTTQSPEANNSYENNYNYPNNNSTISDVNMEVEEIIEKVNSDEENTTTKENENSETNNNSCTPSFSDIQFAKIVAKLKEENFESKRLLKAKLLSNNNCLLTKQVRDIIHTFNFENNRVEFAKYAYHSVADKENYELLLDSFKFQTSKQEIKEFIK